MTTATTHNNILSLSCAIALGLSLCATACNDDGAGTSAETTGDTTGDGDGDPTGDGDGDPTGDGDGDPTGDGDGDSFVFDESPASAFDQIDRMGMPGINTAVISSKDAYNADTPAGDMAGTYVPEIVASLEFLHGALDDDIMGANLTPCAVDDCVAQGGPLVIPDTLKLDLASPAGFPNGRRLADPVMDVTLAVVLLDLTMHEATTLVGVNPTANDVAFLGSFPYLANPN